MEHRWGDRYRVEAAAWIGCADGTRVRGTMHDVSLSGAFIETDAALRLLEWVQVAVFAEEQTLLLQAWVVREGDSGYGLEWQDVETLPLQPLVKVASPRRSAARIPPRPASREPAVAA